MKSEKEQIAEEIKQAIYRGLKLVETKVEGTSTQIVVNKVESRLAMRFMYFFSTIATSYTKTSEKLQKYRCDIYSYEIQNQIFQVKYYQGYGAYKHYDYCKLVWIKELKNSSRPVGRVKVKVKPENLIE
jgi:hypothetical protein